MTKYFHGVSFDKKTIKENGQEQDVVICMTEDEHKDRSYREYLENSTVEKTREKLRKQVVREHPSEAMKNLGQHLKEMQEYKKRKASEHPRKFFRGI